jgi:hypothetical protein
MVDDRAKRGGADRRRVSSGEPYEVSYFANKHDISVEDAKKIINKTRGNREKADAEAVKLKAR